MRVYKTPTYTHFQKPEDPGSNPVFDNLYSASIYIKLYMKGKESQNGPFSGEKTFTPNAADNASQLL